MSPDQVHVQLTLSQMLYLGGVLAAVVGAWLDLRYQVRDLRARMAEARKATNTRLERVEKQLVEIQQNG